MKRGLKIFLILLAFVVFALGIAIAIAVAYYKQPTVEFSSTSIRQALYTPTPPRINLDADITVKVKNTNIIGATVDKVLLDVFYRKNDTSANTITDFRVGKVEKNEKFTVGPQGDTFLTFTFAKVFDNTTTEAETMDFMKTDADTNNLINLYFKGNATIFYSFIIPLDTQIPISLNNGTKR